MKRILATCVTSAVLGLVAMPAYADRGDRDRNDDRGRTHDTRNDRSDRGRDHDDRDDHDRKGGVKIDVDISLGRDRFERPRYETRTERIWIEPTYRTVCDRVWVEAEYQTICDRVWHEAEYTTTCDKVWVDPVYEWRDIVRVDARGCRFTVREQVMVCAGHYEDRQNQVLIRDGWWETVERRVCIHEGYWRTIERQELVCPGHWEMRETRVDCGDRGDRYRW